MDQKPPVFNYGQIQESWMNEIQSQIMVFDIYFFLLQIKPHPTSIQFLNLHNIYNVKNICVVTYIYIYDGLYTSW